MAIFVFQNSPCVAEKVVTFVGKEHAFPVLRREDDVVIDLGERGHVRSVVRPLQGRAGFGTLFRGLAPTAIHVHPLRGCRMVRVLKFRSEVGIRHQFLRFFSS